MKQHRTSSLPRCIAGFLVTFAMLSASAFAQTVTVRVNGTYNSSAATNTFTAPSAPWTLSFQVAAVPSVFTTTSTEFRTLYTNGSFTLNGVPVPVTGSTVIFSTSYAFNIFLDANTQFIVTAPQMFSGTTSNPTILVGSYATTNVTSYVPNPGGGFFDGVSATFSNAVVSASPLTGTPLPRTGILVLTGLAGLGLFELMRRRQARAI
jgi:hypothetical protein